MLSRTEALARELYRESHEVAWPSWDSLPPITRAPYLRQAGHYIDTLDRADHLDPAAIVARTSPTGTIGRDPLRIPCPECHVPAGECCRYFRGRGPERQAHCIRVVRS